MSRCATEQSEVMQCPSISRSRSRRRLASALPGICLLALACSTPKPRKPLPIDCRTPNEEYEFNVLQNFEVGDPAWFGVVDGSPRAEVDPVIEPIEDVQELGEQEPGRCGSASAVVFRAKGFTDWGAFFGDYATLGQNVPGSEIYDGISFWARSAPGSNPYFTLVVDNALTAPIVENRHSKENKCVSELDSGVYPRDSGGASNACGNGFQHNVATTLEWKLYTIPFSEFWQDPTRPNIEPEGLDPTEQLVRFTVRFPTESRIELYMDDLGLYREW